MSLERVCPNCFRKEGTRYNFGTNREAEKAFHQEKWCDCGYSSPQEMMLDQDMGFTNPHWLRIAKYFLENYENSIRQGLIESKDEKVRFFLKLLKSSANNIGKSIELTQRKQDEEYEFIYHGKPEKNPRVNIFDNEFNLSEWMRNKNKQQSNEEDDFDLPF